MELDCGLQPIIHSCKWRGSNKGIFMVLSEDIFMEILCRVPDKPLVRLKCLSKAWNFLISQLCIPIISSPPTARPRPVVGLYCRVIKLTKKEIQFVTRTRQHPLLHHFSGDCLPREFRETKLGNYVSVNEEGDNTGNGKGQLFGWEECISSYGLPFMPHPEDLLDCRNGLLLFLDANSRDYYVSNPLTKQYVLIPRPSWSQQEYLNAALAFDPSKSTCYRIVRFERNIRDRSLVLHVYSSGNRSWSRHSVRQDHPCEGSHLWFRPSTYFNGALFRLSLSWHLIQIDLEKFSVCATELPLTFGQSKGLIGCLGVLMSRLCYANEDGNMMHIWSFENEGFDNVGKWILKHNINIYDLTRGLVLFRDCGPPDSKWVEPIAFHPSSNIVFLGTPIVILRFNLDNNMLEELIRIDKDLIVPGCYHPAFTNVRYLAPFDNEGNICTIPM